MASKESHPLATTALVGGGALLVWLLLRGKGWGLGGPGSGSNSGSPPPSMPASPRQCKVRIAAAGISVDGRHATVDEAVAACKSTERAEVLVTGGARESDYEDLKAAFERAGIQVGWIAPKHRAAVAAPASARVSSVPTLGDAAAPAAGHPATAACMLRLDRQGLTADGARVGIAEAVQRCKLVSRADVTVTEDAAAVVYADLVAALGTAGVIAHVHHLPALTSASPEQRRGR